MNYWEKHYSNGGRSGEGSIGQLRDWKWNIIEKHGGVRDVIDVGCGDLSFWEGRDCSHYIGIDISSTIIKKDKEQRPSWKFICSSAEVELNLKAETVLCLDVLFHITDDEKYIKILENIGSYADKNIFIYTWRKNPFASYRSRFKIAYSRTISGNLMLAFRTLMHSDYDGLYQKYRYFEDYSHIFLNKGFSMEVEFPSIDEYGAMYIFKKNINQ